MTMILDQPWHCDRIKMTLLQDLPWYKGIVKMALSWQWEGLIRLSRQKLWNQDLQVHLKTNKQIIAIKYNKGNLNFHCHWCIPDFLSCLSIQWSIFPRYLPPPPHLLFKCKVLLRQQEIFLEYFHKGKSRTHNSNSILRIQ